MTDDRRRAPRPFDPATFDGSAWGAAWSAGLRRGTESELRSWLDLAMGCADEADAIALAHFRRDLRIDTKPDRTYVTQADRSIEALVRDRVRAAHPDHGMVGEEYGTDAAAASVRWYVDPIDGTHNYVRGVPLFATLLAVERDGELQTAVLSAPALGDRWFAWRGGGAWVRRASATSRVSSSAVASLGDAQVVYSSPAGVRSCGWAPGFDDLVARAWRERGFGDFWGYALVAEGAAEAMVEVGIHPWDLAAPIVLVEEAGGRVTDFGGRRGVDVASVVATNGRLHAEVLEALAGPPAPPGADGARDTTPGSRGA